MFVERNFILFVILFCCVQFSHERRHPIPEMLKREFAEIGAEVAEILKDLAPVRILEPNTSLFCCPKDLNRDYPVVYCYKAAEKRIEHLWMIAELHISLTPDQYELYWGDDEVDVVKHFLSEQSMLTINILFWKHKDVKLNPFNDTCIGVVTTHDYSVKLNQEKVNIGEQWVFIFGILLFHLAGGLAREPLFYYITGVAGGVLLSFMIIIYFLLALMPLKKPTIAAMMVGGIGTVVFLIDWTVHTIRMLILKYQVYVWGYVFTSAIISFFICYRFGPVTNPQSINIIKWSLQTIGAVAMWVSSQHKEAMLTILLVNLLCAYVPVIKTCFRLLGLIIRGLTWLIVSLYKISVIIRYEWILYPFVDWCKDFMRGIRRVIRSWSGQANTAVQPGQLLTHQQYRQQGRAETARALRAMFDSFHSGQIDVFECLSRLRPESREKVLKYLTGRDDHVPFEEVVDHFFAFEGEMTDDEDD